VRENGCPWDEETCQAALEVKNYEILDYAIDNGCPLNSILIELVAWTGPLPLFEYLHVNGAPWSVRTCSIAAINGKMDFLMYARNHGCPWDVTTCTAAVKSEKFKCLRYVVENGCPMTTTAPVEEAAMLGNFQFFKYLHEHRCPWSEDICISLAIQILKFLQITPVDSTCYEEKIFMHKQQLECLVYAWKNGCPWPDGTCFAGSGNGRMDCLVSEPDHDCMWDSKKFEGYAGVIRRRETVTHQRGHIRRLKGPITSVLLQPLLLRCIKEPVISIIS